MMFSKCYLSIFSIVLILLASCVRADKEQNIGFVDLQQAHLEKERKSEKNQDSINTNRILIEALSLSMKNMDKDIFSEEYIVKLEDERKCNVKIESGYFFTKKHSHLVIHRLGLGDIYIDIYAKINNNFIKVLAHKEWGITYINDTIQDINGDNYNDFVVNGYGDTGCCLKAFSLIYLFRPDGSGFSNKFHFLNPTFSPKEKIIRGVCYGHPGETELYKYKWRGENVDTLEYVYYEKDNENNKTGKVIVSKNRFYGDNHRILKRLRTVPKEYTKIEGYDWFTGEGYD